MNCAKGFKKQKKESAKERNLELHKVWTNKQMNEQTHKGISMRIALNNTITQKTVSQSVNVLLASVLKLSFLERTKIKQ